MEVIDVLAKYVPLGQTALWVGLIGFLLWYLRPQIESVAVSFAQRIKEGDEVVTPWVTLRGAPAAIRNREVVGVTAEGLGGVEANKDIEAALHEKRYPSGIVENIYLVHAATITVARTSQRPGIYRVRVWVEAYDDSTLNDITRVTYRLYNDGFPQDVISTESRQNSFELWLNVYGEFTVVACAERRSDAPVWLTRYLDLPGRPPE